MTSILSLNVTNKIKQMISKNGKVQMMSMSKLSFKDIDSILIKIKYHFFYTFSVASLGLTGDSYVASRLLNCWASLRTCSLRMLVFFSRMSRLARSSSIPLQTPIMFLIVSQSYSMISFSLMQSYFKIVLR